MSPIVTTIETDDAVKVTLEKMRRITITQLDATVLEGGCAVEVWRDYSQEFIVARLVADVWGETLGKRTIRHPLNWIEAVKERWLPYRLRRHWPVRYKVHHIEAKAYYPGLRPSLPNHEWRMAAYVRNEPDPYDGRMPEDYA